jgi:hypothetical protein
MNDRTKNRMGAFGNVFRDQILNNSILLNSDKIPIYNNIILDFGNEPGMIGNVAFQRSDSTFYGHDGITWVQMSGDLTTLSSSGTGNINLVSNGTGPNLTVKSFSTPGTGISISELANTLTINSTTTVTTEPGTATSLIATTSLNPNFKIKELRAGTNVGFDTTTPNVITIYASGGGPGSNSIWTLNSLTTPGNQFMQDTTQPGVGYLQNNLLFGTATIDFTANTEPKMFFIGDVNNTANRGAFRAGYVIGTQWDLSNVGSGSVGFGINNTADSRASFVSGENNSVNISRYSAILSGLSNNIISTNGNTQTRNVILSGTGNNILNSLESTICNGNTNTIGFASAANSSRNSIVGGNLNTIGTVADANDSSVLAGASNKIALSLTTINSAILSGNSNQLDGSNSAILTGQDNRITSTSGLNAIITGLTNRIFDTSLSVICSGNTNTIGFVGATNCTLNAILSGNNNTIGTVGTASGNSILGGTLNQIANTSSVQNSTGNSIVSGNNNIINNSVNTIIGTGNANKVGNNAYNVSTNNSGIFSGDSNEIGQVKNSDQCAILTGFTNKLGTIVDISAIVTVNSAILSGSTNILNGGESSIASGFTNTLYGNRSIISTGDTNKLGLLGVTVVNSGIFSGLTNELGQLFNSAQSAIVAGTTNKIATTAVSDNSAILAGATNTLNGTNSTILGGLTNTLTGSRSIISSGDGNKLGLLGVTVVNNSGIFCGLTNELGQVFDSAQSAIVAGISNKIATTAISRNSAILGGVTNTLNGISSTILGGTGNTLTANNSSILAGTGLTLVNNNTAMTQNIIVGADNVPGPGSATGGVRFNSWVFLQALGNYTLTPNDHTVIIDISNNAPGNLIVFLPAAPEQGQRYFIKRIEGSVSHTCNINVNGIVMYDKYGTAGTLGVYFPTYSLPQVIPNTTAYIFSLEIMFINDVWQIL